MHHLISYCVSFISDRYACAIPDPDNEEILITGGSYTKTTVSAYNKTGHLKDLADLNTGRYYHACTSFIFHNLKVYSLKDSNTIFFLQIVNSFSSSIIRS